MCSHSNPRPLAFEELAPGHLAELAALYAEAFNAPPWNDRWTAELAGNRLARMLDNPHAYGLVARDAQGRICAAALGSREVYFDGEQFNLQEFFAALAHRGKGIGGELLRELEKRLLQKGIAECWLFTGRETDGFYEKQGFRAYDGMKMMGKALAASPSTDEGGCG